MKKIGLAVLAVAMVMGLAATCWAASDISFAWDPVDNPAVAGYKFHQGTSTRNYTVHTDVGKVTTWTITGIPDGTYSWAVTAYKANGQESGYSNEVTLTLDTTPPASPKNLKTINVKITVAMRNGKPVITAFATTGP